MPYFTDDRILEILTSGHLRDFIGMIEEDRGEAKSEPYRIGESRGKLELAKDVSAMANGGGGIILIGLKTQRSPVHLADEVVDVRPFQEVLVNREQYHDVLRAWVHGQPKGISIEWYASAEDPARGIVAIIVPNQPETERPFLVTHTLDESDRQIGIVFGFMERRRAGVEPMRVHDLQALLRAGRRHGEVEQRFDELSVGHEYILNRLRSIEERLAASPEVERREPELPPQAAVSPEVLRERRNGALTEAGLQGRPLYSLAAVPRPAVELSMLFQERSELVHALNDPPVLRPSGGFNVGRGSQARIVHGQLRRRLDRGRAALELWRDGTLLFVIEADNFLCWGTRTESDPLRINPLALCESAYGFADLSRVVFGHTDPQPQGVGYTLGLYRLTIGEHTAQLIPGPLRRLVFPPDFQTAPGSSREFEVMWERAEIHPGAVAYALVREVYRWFGIDDEGVPYTSDTESGRVIDPEAIRRAGQ